MPLAPGTRVGPYEVVALLGAGGMGEVYRAVDTQLKRDVALKVLLSDVAKDADRLARFSREAQLLAALNHPNIAHIHGLEPSGGPALVMELVEGPTLADRLASGPLPLDDALAIARQIGDALEAAHDRGIVHRDLKPANIKVRADGTVKVLDFGLAKVLDAADAGAAAPGAATRSPTMTSPAMTRMGMILGTAAYMSPEQARGRAVDKRADIWAFGVVLFEMLTGTNPYHGEEVSDSLAFVLTREPNWSELPESTPAAIRRLLRRCLQKDPRRRLPDIGVARLEIEDVPFDEALKPVATGKPASQPRLARATALAPLAIAAALIGGIVTSLWLQPGTALSTTQVTRFSLTPPRNRPLVFSTNDRDLDVSPDGTQLAYTAGVPSEILLQAFDQLDARAA